MLSNLEEIKKLYLKIELKGLFHPIINPMLFPKHMIINSFKKTAISNKVDGTEDNMFELHEELVKDFDFLLIKFEE